MPKTGCTPSWQHWVGPDRRLCENTWGVCLFHSGTFFSWYFPQSCSLHIKPNIHFPVTLHHCCTMQYQPYRLFKRSGKPGQINPSIIISKMRYRLGLRSSQLTITNVQVTTHAWLLHVCSPFYCISNPDGTLQSLIQVLNQISCKHSGMKPSVTGHSWGWNKWYGISNYIQLWY